MNSRMNYSFSIVLFLLSAVYAIDLTQWKYYSEITSQSQNSEYYSLNVTPQMYDIAKTDLSDIRIIDANGKQTPYIIVRPHDITDVREFSPGIMNRSNSHNASLVTLDFGSQILKNSIKVITEGTNFRRSVKVEGSNDNISFFTLVEDAFIFAVTDRNFSRFSDIDLPTNDYRYLRITVYPMPSEKKSPEIRDVHAFVKEKKLALRSTVSVALTRHYEDSNENLSIYEYDLGFKNIPVCDIQLSIDNISFYRQVTIEGRNAAKRRVKIEGEDNLERYEDVNEPWNYITGGAVYRYIPADGKEQTSTSLQVLGNSFYKYIKITIRNYDDYPLTLSAAYIQMIPHRIIFPANEKKPFVLYLGCQSANPPQYDITHKLTNPLELDAAFAVPETISENPKYSKISEKPVPWTEQHKNLLFIILIVLVVLIGLYMIKSFKSIEPVENK